MNLGECSCGPSAVDWLIDLADDGAFGRQPTPAATQPPAKFDGDRARWMPRVHGSGGPRPRTVVPWLEQEADAIEPLDDEDQTGVSSGIEEHEGAPA